MSDEIPKLLNLKQLAKAFGVPYYWTLALRASGMPLYGGRISAPDAIAWLKEHPRFTPNPRKVSEKPPLGEPIPVIHLSQPAKRKLQRNLKPN